MIDHPYNRWSSKKQKQLVIFGNSAAFLFLIALLVVTLLVSPLFLLLLPLFFVFAQLVDVPTNLKTGQLKRYSYTLLTQRKKTSIHLHTSTLFDCLFIRDTLHSTNHPKRWLLADMLTGLIQLSNTLSIERDTIEKVEGTTYFINKRTLEKLGFKVERPSSLQRMILAANFLTLMLTNYLISGKLKWPQLSNTLKFSCSVHALRIMQPKLKALENQLTIKHS